MIADLSEDIVINIEDLPDFLKNSDFYRSPAVDGEETITLKKRFFLETDQVNCIEDLYRLFEIIRYWGLDKTPYNLYKFVYENKNKINKKKYKPFFDSFPELIELKNEIYCILHISHNKLGTKCVQNGWINLLEFLNSIDYKFNNTLMSIAVVCDNFECVKFLNKIGFKFENYIIPPIAKRDSADQLKYVLDNGFKWNDIYFYDFCNNSSFNLIKFLVENKYVSGESGHDMSCYYERLILGGRLDIISYLFDNKFISNKLEYLSILAISNGNIDILKFFHEKGTPLTADMAKEAAIKTNLECLRYLYDNNCIFDETVYDGAINANSEDCVKFLINIKCPFGTKYYLAADKGYLNLVKIFEKEVNIWDERLFINLASVSVNDFIVRKGGHIKNYLECVKYAFNNNCPWNEEVLINSMETECIESIKFLIDNGCPISDDALEEAIYFDLVEIVEILHKKGQDLYSILISVAIENDSEDSFLYLFSNCCFYKTDEVTKYLSVNRHLDLLKKMIKNGYEPEKDLTLLAAEDGSIDILRYLKDINFEFHESTCVYAVRSYSLDCLKIAHECGCPIDENVKRELLKQVLMYGKNSYLDEFKEYIDSVS